MIPNIAPAHTRKHPYRSPSQPQHLLRDHADSFDLFIGQDTRYFAQGNEATAKLAALLDKLTAVQGARFRVTAV